MRCRRHLVASSALAVLLAQCGVKAPPPVVHASLDGAVARVGEVRIDASLVSTVAAARGLSSQAIIGALVDDALAAQGAEARGFGRDPRVTWGQTAALAARVPARLAEEASAQGPPTDRELESVSVVQAVVMRAPNVREEDALGIARGIQQAVTGVRDPDDFIARAQAVPHPHAQVVAQPVGPFAADGIEGKGGEIDTGFVAASFALRAPYETSPVVASPFGWHVIQLVERTPAGSTELDARRSSLAPAVQRLRARTRLDELLRARRAAERVEISIAADELMTRATALP